MSKKNALDRDTEYRVVRSETSIDIDGFRVGEPTGEIECCACGRSAMNIDEIPHTQECPQRWARTEYWRQRFLAEAE